MLAQEILVNMKWQYVWTDFQCHDWVVAEATMDQFLGFSVPVPYIPEFVLNLELLSSSVIAAL